MAGATIFENPIQLNDSGLWSSGKVHLTSAQILALNVTPILLIAAPGAGLTLDLVSAMYKFNYLTTTYVCIGNCLIYSTSLGIAAGSALSSDVNIITSTVSRKKRVAFQTVSNPNSNMVANDSISIALTGAATVGDGTIDLYLFYRIIIE